jgi:hypothetical protein
MVDCYFAYGSNMNPARMRERGMQFSRARGAKLPGLRLVFDKASKAHPQIGHANLVYDPAATTEGVLYTLVEPAEIARMDPFEHAPINYSRDVVRILDGTLGWTYFANPAVRRAGLKPSRSYLNHLLAGKEFLSPDYFQMLYRWDVLEDR